MSHFLERLVERTRGTIPRVEPIIAPRFAPGPIAEITTEVEAAAPRPSREKETAPRSESRERELVRQEVAPPEAQETQREERTMPEPEQLLVPPEMVTRVETGSFVRQIGPEDIPEAAPANGALPQPTRVETHARRRGSAPPARASRATRVVTGGGDPGRVPLRPNEPTFEAPIVRVTIGRIEVRAETSPAPPARKSPRRSEPKLTLDAYLKERKEGRR